VTTLEGAAAVARRERGLVVVSTLRADGNATGPGILTNAFVRYRTGLVLHCPICLVSAAMRYAFLATLVRP